MNNKLIQSEQVVYLFVSFRSNNSSAIALDNHLEEK